MKEPTDHKAATRIAKARTSLLLKHFFFGRLALNLKMVEEPGFPTLATDGKHIFYNPQFVHSISDEQLKAEVVHEVMHNVLEHTTRRNGRNPERWNIAADYAENIIIRDAGFKLGKDWLLDDQYKGMSAEQIYEKLPKNTSGNFNRFDLRPAPTGADKTALELEWKVAVAGAAIEAKKYGSMPHALESIVEEIVNPKVPWQALMRQFFTQRTHNDYSWQRPNRRYAPHGICVPSLYSESMGPLDIWLDTSGSISRDVFDAFVGEVTSLAAETRPERVRVIHVDAAIQHVETFEQGESVEITTRHGKGGTSFVPAIEFSNKEPPTTGVYLTDLEGDFGAEPPYPVLWCSVTKAVAPWGQTIYLEV